VLTQVETFARTLYARYQQLFGVPRRFPPMAIPANTSSTSPKRFAPSKATLHSRREFGRAAARFRTIGINKMLDAIAADLAAIRVTFDVWFAISLYGHQPREAMACCASGVT
jgi:hypothetical protein